jgi:exonuclease III
MGHNTKTSSGIVGHQRHPKYRYRMSWLHHVALFDRPMRLKLILCGDLKWTLEQRSVFTTKFQRFVELLRQKSFGIARQQANTLNLDMFYTCGYNCENKPGILA